MINQDFTSIRKIYKVGGYSYILTLPKKLLGKEWLKQINLQKREVYIEEIKQGLFNILRYKSNNSFICEVREEFGLFAICLSKYNIGANRDLLKDKKDQLVYIRSNLQDKIQVKLNIEIDFE